MKYDSLPNVGIYDGSDAYFQETIVTLVGANFELLQISDKEGRTSAAPDLGSLGVVLHLQLVDSVRWKIAHNTRRRSHRIRPMLWFNPTRAVGQDKVGLHA